VKTWLHLGNGTPDYRSIMAAHHDFYIGDKLIPASRVVICQQTHSREVHICSEADSGAGFGAHPQIAVADGFVTNVPHQYLLIRTADCTPVLFTDKLHRAVGAVHSGREGTRKNIVGRAVELLKSEYGIEPGDLCAWIGAGICVDHYRVNRAVYDEFHTSLIETGISPGPRYDLKLDIRHCIFQQLIAAGIAFRDIEQDHSCTFETQGYHSFRRDGTHNRQIKLVGIEYD